MPHTAIILADPGIDGAFAIAVALNDPDINLVGLAATAGNVDAQQATSNVHVIVEQLDPPRFPRVGAALPIDYEANGKHLHGPGGLGGASFPLTNLHHPHVSDKLIVDLVRLHPRETTIITLGPLTALARALDRDLELPNLVQRLICVGGSWHEPGNAGPVSEFHFWCDPAAARQVLQAGFHATLLPLDVTRKLLFSPTDLLELTASASRACRFLGQIIPFGIRASSNYYGVEGFYLKDVLGIIALVRPEALITRHVSVNAEVRGELTRGMSVVDTRRESKASPNVDLAIDVDTRAVRDYITGILGEAR